MKLQTKQLVLAVKSIAEEKSIPEDSVKDVIEQALAAAYRKDYGDREQSVRAEINQNTGDVKVFVEKIVVDNVENPFAQISLSDAKKINPNVNIEETVEIEDHPEYFGRVAAQTAKQVIMQRLREAERENVLTEYSDKIGQVLTGTVARVDQRLVRVDLGRAQGILPMSEQIRGEHYSYGQRIKVYLKEVDRESRGPQLILSRADKEFIRHLFENEVPEMENGAVEIKAIAREAGIRTKIAVSSTVPGVDPVGTFVGGHGTRVQAVMGEIGDSEKIDIIMWQDKDESFIKEALKPTEVASVKLNDKEKRALVKVPEDQLSVAIGKGGQNVRLASKLTGWEIDVEAETRGPKQEEVADNVEETQEEKPKEEKRKRPASKAELEESLLATLEAHTDANQEDSSQDK